jgi:hypothetical protein
VWDGEVAEEGAGVWVDDGEVGVVAFECGEESERDGVGRVERESCWRVEVFNCGLDGCQLDCMRRE